MKQELKQQIINEALTYIADKGMSQNQLCISSKINAAYLNRMLNGEFVFNGTEISDKYFNQLADFIQFKIEKTYWPIRVTPQMLAVLGALDEAKNHPTAIMVIGETGSGKTCIKELFTSKHPVNTYTITVADYFRTGDIINEVCRAMNIEPPVTPFDKIQKINQKLREIRRSGGSPVIVFDEAENMKLPSLKMCKGIYDSVFGYASIVLIGTEALEEKINAACRNPKTCMPQLKRRFKAGTRYLPGIDTNFKEFLEPLNLEKGLENLLKTMCGNYGELRDYLEPALREADKAGKPLTEDLFRVIYNLPAKKK